MNDSRTPEASEQASRRVLLVEDNPQDVDLLREFLAEGPHEFRLESAGRLADAIAALQSTQYDLVLTDLSLPDSRGCETFGKLQAAAAHLPIIVLSGFGDEALALRTVERGAQDYLLKGRIDHHGLVRAMRYALERHRLKREADEARAQLEQRVAERTAELATSNVQLKTALDQLQEAQQRAVQQERLHALGRMASCIAHDFNNALAPIVGYSELLLEPSHETQRRSKEYLRLIHLAAIDSAEVVRRLREFFRCRDEHDIFAPVVLNELVRQVVALTRPRWSNQALGRGAHIDLRLDLKRVPTICGSESELREMLINLIFNSVDAISGNGSITIRTFTRGDSAVLEVCDTGSGMTEEVRLRCLEPFFSTKAEHGTGLGLAMVYGIIRRHEGELAIESAPGEGTTISIALVANHEAPAHEAPAVSRAAVKPLRILVVDDEPSVREVMEALLGEDGHRIETACDGVEGLEKFRQGGWDLVITDRAMPRMNGAELSAALRELSADVPIVLVTGFADLMSGVGDHPSAIDVVVPKPFTLPRLRTAIAQALAMHAPEAPALVPGPAAMSQLHVEA